MKSITSAIPLRATLTTLVILAMACAGIAQSAATPLPDAPASPAAHSRPDAELSRLLRLLEPEARKLNVPMRQVEQMLVGFHPDADVVKLATTQPEHVKSTGEYLRAIVDAERITQGRGKLVEQAAVLARIERNYGVHGSIVAAIWGVETRFGAIMGRRPVVRSLATLALADERRSGYWRRELIHAVKIAVGNRVDPAAMLGSWAGAMGHTQFMPSTYNRLAVDFDGNGHRDIWSDPVDALASAANYLSRAGWQPNQPWGFEVELPRNFDYALAAPDIRRPATLWHMLGVRRPGGREWPTNISDLRLLLPAGAQGPAFLVGRNFQAVMRYNPSTKYALAVCLLADALAGQPPLSASWPDEPPMTRADREELQSLLLDRGLSTGGVDGIIGHLTRDAIRSYQKMIGFPPDGHPSLELLQRLRADNADTTTRID